MPKINEAFAARLSKLAPDQTVRAVVLLNLPSDLPEDAHSQPRGQRREVAQNAIVGHTEDSLSSVDRVLEEYGGHRISDEPNLLGAVAVEATSKGLHALASSDNVRAVIEDQPLLFER